MNRLALLLALLMTSPALYAAENKMFDKMKTYCFGRYLVDIPHEAELKGQGNKYIAASIKTEKISREAMLKLAEKKELTLKNEDDKYEDQFAETRFSNSPDKRLVLAKSEPFGRLIYSLDAYKFLGNGYTALSSVRALNKKNIQETLSEHEAYLQGIRYRSDRDIPKEAGFCIANGFVSNDGKSPQFEMASITFALKNNPDVWFSIDSFTLSKPEPSLLERQKAAKLDERFPGKIKAIRKGARTVNGMQGEESLNEFPSDNDMGVAHNFTWEAQGGFDNPLNPKVSIQLTSGEGVAGVTGESSLSAAQMQRLYESVIKSIRVRPVAQ
ncbi:T6SS immunity protein Tli4 family protein [Chromobacterium haemolyticum]|uniref:T6SS immunity protein Tli4 family protein n=1 Tax=Chromobacterium haemolyticum TaxID=394935 RepID=UPI0011314761|nr:T6SS immunity protein Tli4 family protein [Chromobacterium haemolyticum]